MRELGAGGFGTVHLGETSSGGLAAVKLLHPYLAKDARVRRYFSRELVNARRVQGFCLAEVVDADAEVDRPWIATEYVEGPTLARAVRDRGPFSGGGLLRLTVQTITVLSAIHAAGVVHRDFKPANILLGLDGPRVIDFGIARALDVDTESTNRVGTLGYMAPEQIEGTPLGPAADLFAWGAVMIYAATGAPAFPGPSPAARINRILNQPPEIGDLADPLLSIVQACTAKDAAQRPTARHVWDMLLTGRTTAPVPRAASEDRRPAGEAAEQESGEDEDEPRLSRAARAGGIDAMARLGSLMFDRGELDEVERWAWIRSVAARSGRAVPRGRGQRVSRSGKASSPSVTTGVAPKGWWDADPRGSEVRRRGDSARALPGPRPQAPACCGRTGESCFSPVCS